MKGSSESDSRRFLVLEVPTFLAVLIDILAALATRLALSVLNTTGRRTGATGRCEEDSKADVNTVNNQV